jgi:hypothetical protein
MAQYSLLSSSMRHVKHEGRVWVIAVEAPAGHVWNASGTHEYVGATFYTRPTLADRDAALVEVFKLGSRPCDIEDCDYCNNY